MPRRRRPAGGRGERAEDATLYRAAEVIEGTGITRQMFYSYLAIGLLAPRGSTTGGRNLYGADAFRRIRLIRRLNRSGYTLRDIAEIFMRRES